MAHGPVSLTCSAEDVMRTVTRPVRRVVIALLLASPVVLASCGGGDDATGVNTNGTYTATIDGSAWTANGVGSAASAGGIFTLTGVQTGSATGMTMTLYSIGAPGTFPLGVGPTVVGGIASVTQGSSIWSTPLSGAAGTVTVTAVSPTRIAGTFAFNAPPLIGQTVTSTRAVTSGRFDIPVTGPATLVVPDNAGSKVTGTLASQAFNAATIVTVTSPTSGTFTFGASNASQSMTVILSGYTGVGTYALGSGGVARTITLTNIAAPTGSWGGAAASTSGTLVITSATSTRIKGTVTATLQPIGAGSATTVTASFDIGVQ
jgi:Family of unknown function (DUF6252)